MTTVKYMLQCKLTQLEYSAHDSDLSTLNEIPTLQRRRLSSLAKLALHTAKKTLEHAPPIDYIVWSSCYGDEQKTVAILHDIADGQVPSPTQFSTSVHNAVAGLYSILFKDHTPSVSLSSGMSHAWQDAILEAYSYLKSHQKQHALVVCYDEPLPEIYIKSHDLTAPFALAAIVSLDAQNLNIHMVDHQHPSVFQAADFYQFWTNDTAQWHSNGWVWQKC